MNEFMFWQDIREKLKKADISARKYNKHITEMTDGTFYDMSLKVQADVGGVRLYCHERGQIVFDEFVEDFDVAEYAVLYEIISRYFRCKFENKLYKKKITYQEFKKMCDDRCITAMKAIDERYAEMYKEGKTALNMFGGISSSG